MAQPPAYNKSTNFANYAAANPSAPFPAASTDSEFSAVETTLDAINTNLALIQRDDGQLKNNSVHPDALTAATRLLFSDWVPRGLWVTATSYAVKDVVESSGTGYVALSAHVSGASFATDLAAGKWMRISPLENAQGVAVASANNLALGSDGNYFQITGATQINLLDGSNWQGGSRVTLKFNSTPTVKHNQVASGNYKPILLAGAVDFVASANDTLSLVYDGTDLAWYESSRAVI